MSNLRDVINQAIDQKRVISIEYRDYHGNRTSRRITPLRWVTFDRFEAHCHLRNDEREFRIDRILQIRFENDHLGDSIIAASSQPPVESTVELVSTTPFTRGSTAKGQRGQRTASNATAIPKQPVNRVVTGEHWSDLVHYYTECLVRENRQQFVIKNETHARYFISTNTQGVHEFFEGRIGFQLQVDRSSRRQTLAQFIDAGKDRPGQQLCLGYPTFVADRDSLAPLIVSSVTVERSPEQFSLSADEPSPSYAALSTFQIKDEEIASLLVECGKSQPRQGQTLSEAWEEFLVNRLSEFVGHPLQRLNFKGQGALPFKPGTLLTVPCLFWVHSEITANLISELHELASPRIWTSASVSLKGLFDRVPEHDYPVAPPLTMDDKVYVTEVNEEQRQAIAAMCSEDLTVVTGPPGTGKSQLVLNIIAQAVLNGQSVLFASRNNEAVNVVMNRLKEEMKFAGAIRTGNTQYRRIAARDMAAALDQITAVDKPPSISSLRSNYRTARNQLQDTIEKLHQARELAGLLTSYSMERQDLALRLPKPVLKIAESYAPSFCSEEAEHLEITLSTLLTVGLTIKNEATLLENELVSIVGNKDGQNAIVAALYSFERQWGSFGGRFLHPGHLETLDDLQDYARTWLGLLPALGIQSHVTQLKQQHLNVYSVSLQCQEEVPPQLASQVKSTACERTTQELLSLVQMAEHLNEQCVALANNRLPFWTKFLAGLGLINPVKKILKHFALVRDAIGLEWNPWSVEGKPTKAEAISAWQGLLAFVQSCAHQSRLDDLQIALEGKRQELDSALQSLPQTLQADVRRIELPSSVSDSLREQIDLILVRIDELIKRRDQLTMRVNAKLDDNEDSLVMLESLKATPAGKDKRLWVLRVPSNLEVIISHLTKWQNLISLWKTDEAILGIRRQLETLPPEDELVALAKDLERKKTEAGTRMICARWLEHAKGLDTMTLQKTRDYASASQQLAETYDPSAYSHLKSITESNLQAALQVFPVWATTNLSARTNLPLTAELFDIVIIDEASQCDIPSALPLLYRAKQAIIIGDANQLRHVATLYKDSDYKAASDWGIAPEAFLYNDRSLFDIAARSIGARPGTLMLREHYRSDPQIIEFSNEEFYNHRLVVRTDLSLRGIPQSFLDTDCGAFWIHREGTAEHPSGGSAFNLEELKALQELVPSILEAVNQHEKSDRQHSYKFSIGIVTPYREQAKRIRTWVSQAFGENDRIAVGTAHTFQGSERDIMIFSPVVAPGLSDGSHNWLNNTTNLLNVAITRARALLVVVGHWDYCRNLPPSSKYHRLAFYVGDRLGHRLQSTTDLPLLGGKQVIVGTLTGGEHSRTTLRRFIASCREFVWWVDPYLQNHIFDFFLSVLQHPAVDLREIRLLTSSEQSEASNSGKPALDLERARIIAGEFSSHGIRFELRLLPKKELPHDRFLYSVGQSINMPPFGGAYGDHKHISEYTPSETRPDFFEKYWEQARPI